jgi:UDP-N-acetyl-D-glucosamine dehydrogenase
MTREHAALAGRKGWVWNPPELSSFDCALVVTDHDGVDYQLLAEKSRLVVDTRNACARAGAALDKVVQA